ncbi:carboxypeptidase-like regulatory domain-containing protein [Flavobacterium sp. j3]|uniref:Carboxypeptidase-like regulatory domain-containing protein n=1 Tax=Flavobacterium aureirubrum TaxID=3133147 RepID=A0ABU9N890_9FLAO
MKLYIILLLAISINSFSQDKTINGEIKDAENKTYLQYANIGISNKNTGTVSNSNGKFSLKLNESINENDLVTFSYVGYQTKTIAISKLNLLNNVIELEPEKNQLNEVVVKFVKPKPKILGRNSKGFGLMHTNFYTYYEKDVDDRLSKEIGMKFKLKKDCKINDLNFNITSNEFSSLKFRLNFYKIENGFPTELIVEKDIVFEIKDEFKGWFYLDLKPYDIYLDKETEDIAITIQWVESKKANEKSKYFGISTAMSATETSFFREKSMDSWKKSGQSLSFYFNTMCK